MNGLVEYSSASSETALHEILLDYLRQMDAHCWPGIDGLTLDVVLACYARAAAAGHVPGKEDLLRQHPELAVALEAFFATHEPAAKPPHDSLSCGLSTEVRAD